MDSNLQNVIRLVDYIETHLESKLDLESLANQAGYSKYHLHRMFTNIVGFPIHSYVQRRRLTEAARRLVFTNQTIMEIALFAGYETQQSFTAGFKALFHCSPQRFRHKQSYFPLQLKFEVDGKKQLRGDVITDIKTTENGEILLAGYKANTRKGFSVIGKCWRRLHKNKDKIGNRLDMNYLIGFNDYSRFSYKNEQQVFGYYAAAEVSEFLQIPRGMECKGLSANKYVVFGFIGKCQDSMQPIVEYIYQQWFPQATCQCFKVNILRIN